MSWHTMHLHAMYTNDLLRQSTHLHFSRGCNSSRRNTAKTLVAGVIAVAVFLLISLGLTSCSTKGNVMDATQHTAHDIERLTLQQQFELYAQRYERAQQVMSASQLQVAGPEVEWQWISAGIAPSQGHLAPIPLQGATAQNSYFILVSRSLDRAQVSNEVDVIEHMRDFFHTQGWHVRAGQLSNVPSLEAVTDEGPVVHLDQQPSGQLNLTVIAGPYWGDTSNLLNAIVTRIPPKNLGTQSSTPGNYTQFPLWSDPIVNPETLETGPQNASRREAARSG